MLTRLSLILIAMLAVLPYTSTIKLPPIPSFWSEWVAVVLAGAWLAALRRPVVASEGIDPAKRAGAPNKLSVPWAVLSFAALGAVLLLQLLAHLPMFVGAPLMTLGVLLLASLVCLAGARLRHAGELPQLLDPWALALLAALLLNLLATLLERYGWHLYVDEWGWRRPPGRAEGLLGQPNHLAVFAVLGGAAAHYLWMRRVLPSAGHILASFCSAALVAASASRAGALLWIVMVIFAALALREDPRRTLGWRLLVAGAVLFVALQAAWVVVDPGGSTDVAALRADNRGRVELLRDSWELVGRHPWFGVGYGNFMSARWTELSGSLMEPAANHAHNLVAQLAVELGVLPALLILLPLTCALWGCLRVVVRRAVPPEQFLAATIALVLAGYSLAEYPLWYTFFLLPFALALGAVEQREMQISVSRASNTQRLIGWGFAGAVCVLLAWDYHRSEEIYSSLELQQRQGNGAMVRIPLQETSQIASLSAFDVYANLMYSRALKPDGLFMQYKLEVTERAMLTMTNQETIARQVALLTAADDVKMAGVLLGRTKRNPDLERTTREVLAHLAAANPKVDAFVKTLPPLAPTQ